MFLSIKPVRDPRSLSFSLILNQKFGQRPSKSCLHHAATIVEDYEWLHEIIERQERSHAHGSLLGDATGIAIIRYAEWEDAKKGIISRREFVKLHIVTDVKGRKIVPVQLPWDGRTTRRCSGR